MCNLTEHSLETKEEQNHSEHHLTRTSSTRGVAVSVAGYSHLQTGRKHQETGSGDVVL